MKFIGTINNLKLAINDANDLSFVKMSRLNKIRWNVNMMPAYQYLSNDIQNQLKQWNLCFFYMNCDDICDELSLGVSDLALQIDAFVRKLCSSLDGEHQVLGFAIVLDADLKYLSVQPLVSGTYETRKFDSEGDIDQYSPSFYSMFFIGKRIVSQRGTDLVFGTIEGRDPMDQTYIIAYDNNQKEKISMNNVQKGLNAYFQLQLQYDDDASMSSFDFTRQRKSTQESVDVESDFNEGVDVVDSGFSSCDELKQSCRNHRAYETVASYPDGKDFESRFRFDKMRNDIEKQEEESEESSNKMLFLPTLGSFLRQTKVSRDIDSIAILGNDLAEIIEALEDSSIVKLSQLVSDVPSTSSRHSVKMKIKTHSRKEVWRYIPLNVFQNIRLGLVTAGNVRFHINIYCLRNEEVYKTGIKWRPFTKCRRQVVSACLNLARLFQCNMVIRIKKLLLELQEDIDSKDHILQLLDDRQAKTNEMTSRHSQHWVSAGEMFYTNSKDTCKTEISSVKKEAIPFLKDFNLALELVAYGILSVKEIWSWVIPPFDNLKNTDGTIITAHEMKYEGQILFRNKLFVLTAAGVKNDFTQFPPYLTKDHVLMDEKHTSDDEHIGNDNLISDDDNISDFNSWLHKAGAHNERNIARCFHDNYESENQTFTVSVDDGLTFNPLQSEVMYLPVANNEHSSTFIVDSNIESLGNDENEDTMSLSGPDEIDCHSDHVSDREINDFYDDVADHHNDEIHEDDDNAFIYDIARSQNKRIWIDKSLRLPSFPKSLVKHYSIFNCPISESEHTGHIRMKRNEEDNLLMFVDGDEMNGNGTMLGGQKYSTAAKGLKYSNILKNMSQLQNMDKSSFGLMQVLPSETYNHSDQMAKCLSLLKMVDFSKNATVELISRNACLRLETFRSYFPGCNKSRALLSYPIDVLNMPVWATHKKKFVENYASVLEKSIRSLANVFDHLSVISDRPRHLSSEAKMIIQFCSEIVSYELGTPSGYSQNGPITKSLIHYFRKGINFNTLRSNEDSRIIRMISDYDKELIEEFDYGLDPMIWTLMDQHGRPIRDIISSIIEAHTNKNDTISQPPKLSSRLIEDTRLELRKNLFRFEKNNKEKDLYSWMLFISEFVIVKLRRSGSTISLDKGSAFDAIDYKAFCYYATQKEENCIEILDGLADLFWICYDWEWKSDILRGYKTIDDQWPTIFSQAMQLKQILQEENTSIEISPIKKRGEEHKNFIGTMGKFVIGFPFSFNLFCYVRKLNGIVIHPPGELEEILFQGHHKELGLKNTENRSNSKNWSSTVYLNLFKHISKQLFLSRQHITAEVSNVSGFLLSQEFFLTRIALRRIMKTGDAFSRQDHHILWKTTKSNRLKSKGVFIQIDEDRLRSSARDEAKIIRLQQSQYKVPLPRLIQESIDEPLSDLCKMKGMNNIPFPLNNMIRKVKGHKKIGFGNVLMLAVIKQVGGFLNNCDMTLSQMLSLNDVRHIWEVLVTRVVVQNKSISTIQSSGVFSLWTTFDSFYKKWKSMKHSILKKIDCHGSMEIVDLERAVDQISFVPFHDEMYSATCLKRDEKLEPPYFVDSQFIADFKNLTRMYVKCLVSPRRRKYSVNQMPALKKKYGWTCDGDIILYLLNQFRQKNLKR